MGRLWEEISLNLIREVSMENGKFVYGIKKVSE